MQKRKVHVALKPLGDIQRCQRCGSILATNGFWPFGGYVVSDGRGNMRVLTSDQLSGLRMCRSKETIGAPEPECTCEYTDVDVVDASGCEVHGA